MATSALHFANNFCKLKHVDFSRPAVLCETYKFCKYWRGRCVRNEDNVVTTFTGNAVTITRPEAGEPISSRSRSHGPMTSPAAKETMAHMERTLSARIIGGERGSRSGGCSGAGHGSARQFTRKRGPATVQATTPRPGRGARGDLGSPRRGPAG
jgi:hypothetical protein